MLAAATDTSWSPDPVVIAALLAVTGVYVVRWRHVRSAEGARAAGAWRLAAFLGGIAVFVGALLSPIDTLGHQMASAHMVQHVLLLDLAPVLMLLGFTKAILRPATRRLHRIERQAGFFAHPAFAVILYSGAMWLWHVPALYDAALANDAIHVLEHTFFVAAGFLYWWYLLSPIRSRQRLEGLGPIVYMATTKLAVGMLGILLTFAPVVLYDYSTGHLGLTPLEDQNVAGLIMALEQSIVMGIALAWLFARALIEDEQRSQREERYGDDPLADDAAAGRSSGPAPGAVRVATVARAPAGHEEAP